MAETLEKMPQVQGAEKLTPGAATTRQTSGIVTPEAPKPKNMLGKQLKAEAQQAFGGGRLRQDADEIRSYFSKDAFNADWKRLSDSFRSVWTRKNPQTTETAPQTETPQA